MDETTGLSSGPAMEPLPSDIDHGAGFEFRHSFQHQFKEIISPGAFMESITNYLLAQRPFLPPPHLTHYGLCSCSDVAGIEVLLLCAGSCFPETVLLSLSGCLMGCSVKTGSV